MIPLHQQVKDIASKQLELESKLDEIIGYVKPVTPAETEISIQQQLNDALSQIELLKQALINQAQWLTQQVQQMQVEPILEVLEPEVE